ncbi:DUF4245 domain-containing protein [Kineococcus gynurae]|uniref:DUF4245 domain-containing protein n=1 Tax=Kineococcus gynurae TaxID=452979 RepID=A0ABV5LNG2_9ACTN
MSSTGSPTDRPSRPRAEQGVPRRRGGGSVSSMIISMALIIGAVLVIVLLVPRPNTIEQPAVDVANAAEGATSRLDFVPPVPVGLDGWTPTAAVVNRSTNDVVTWHVNYRTDSGEYLALDVARGATAGWERALSAGGGPDGEQQIDGQTWERLYQADRGRSTLVREADGLTVLVSGETGYPVLAELVQATERAWSEQGRTWG